MRVAGLRRSAQGAAHGNGDGFGAEADQGGCGAQALLDGGADVGHAGRGGQAFQRGADVLQGFGGFQKEVSGHLHAVQPFILYVEIDGHELAAVYLVFTMLHDGVSPLMVDYFVAVWA